MKLKRRQEENTYNCGESLFAPDDNYYQSIVTRQQLNCSSPMETTYYGSVTVTFKPIFFHSEGKETLTWGVNNLNKKQKVQALTVMIRTSALGAY